MRNWYAIKRPTGDYVEDAVAMSEGKAWEYAFDIDDQLTDHPALTQAEVGEAMGYTCVEVWLVDKDPEINDRIVGRIEEVVSSSPDLSTTFEHGVSLARKQISEIIAEERRKQ